MYNHYQKKIKPKKICYSCGYFNPKFGARKCKCCCRGTCPAWTLSPIQEKKIVLKLNKKEVASLEYILWSKIDKYGRIGYIENLQRKLKRAKKKYFI